jgi:hypothetical protein
MALPARVEEEEKRPGRSPAMRFALHGVSVSVM